MQFLYCSKGGERYITIEKEIYHYIFRVRRYRVGDEIYLRNLSNPEILYLYRIDEVSRRSGKLSLISERVDFRKSEKTIIVGWCIVDSKTIEKYIAMLNELGVAKVVFIYCDYSQHNIKVDTQRLEKILQTSSMQSGRYDILDIEIVDEVDIFLKTYPDTIAIDFSDTKLEKIEDRDISILVGPEGGFSERERKLFQNIKGLSSPYILKSSTAVVSAVAILI